MTSRRAHGSAPILYPAFCHRASPTLGRWVKLTAADVHALRDEPGFAGQNILFHLNHPIRFAYLCGPIVAIDVLADDAGLVLLTLDDGSGATIEVKIAVERPAHRDGRPRADERASLDDGYAQLARPSPATPAVRATALANVTVHSTCDDAECHLSHVRIDGTTVEPGTVIKAKGTFSGFRGMRQLQLERTAVVRGVAEEARVWAAYGEFVERVLARPWRLAAGEVRRLEEASLAEARAEAEREAMERAAERRRREKREARAKRWEEVEAKREARRQAEREQLDGGALDRPKRAVAS